MSKFLSGITLNTLRIGLEKITRVAAGVLQISGKLRLGNNEIQDSGGTARVTTSITTPFVTLGSDTQLAAGIFEATTATDPTNATGFKMWAKAVAGVYFPHGLSSLGTTIGVFPMIGGPVGFAFAKGQMGNYTTSETAAGASGLLAGVEDTTHTGSGTTTYGSYDSTHGAFVQFATGTTSGNNAGLQLGTAGSGLYSRDGFVYLLVKFRLNSTADTRFFAGFTDKSLDNMVDNADPESSANASYWGIQWSTAASDTTFYSVKGNGSGSQTKTNTSHTVTTNPYYLFLAAWGTFPIVVIFDNTFAQVYGALGNNTNAPAAGTRLHPVIGIETQTGSAKTLDVFNVITLNNK